MVSGDGKESLEEQGVNKMGILFGLLVLILFTIVSFLIDPLFGIVLAITLVSLAILIYKEYKKSK